MRSIPSNRICVPSVLILIGACLHFVASIAGDERSESTRGEALFGDYELPILKKHCYDCHSRESETASGGLVVDSRSGLLKGGDLGPAVVPGKPDKSLLLAAVQYRDDSLQMPPDGKLPDESDRASGRVDQ